MATPALRSLRMRFRDSRIVALVRPVVAQVLEGLPYWDAWYVWNPRGGRRTERTWTIRGALVRERFDLAVLFTNSFRSAALAWSCRVPRRLGYARDGRGWLLNDRLTPLKRHGRFLPVPAVDYYNSLARHLGCQHVDHQLELRTSLADERAADNVWKVLELQHARVVLLNPGSAFGSAKRWPAAYFGELARRIVRQGDAKALVLCGPSEVELATEIVKRAGCSHVGSLADFKLSIGLSKACVRRSDLLITTDSGPRHFAAAFGVPVITLFGPTHQVWSETYFAKAVHLQKQVSCGPCQQRECPLQPPFHHCCMRELKPQEVFDAYQTVIGRHCGGGRRSA